MRGGAHWAASATAVVVVDVEVVDVEVVLTLKEEVAAKVAR